MILLKLAILFLIIFALIFKKCNLSIIMGSAFVCLHIIFQTPLNIVSENFLLTADNVKVYYLFVIVCSIVFLGNIMEAQGKINSIIHSLNVIFSDVRYLFIFFPAFIGLLPMPGGAMFTAPMLNKAGDELNMSKEKKVFFNYWFRHIWEYVWPLYPAFIIMRNILGVNFIDLIKAFYVYTIIAVVVGTALLFLIVDKKINSYSGNKTEALQKIFRNIWPILFIITSIFLINVKYKFSEIHFIVILFFLNIVLLIRSKMTVDEKKDIFLRSYTKKMFFLILFIFLFKDAVDILHIPEQLSFFVRSYNLSSTFLLFLIPFVSGMMTGLTYGIVAISFPICMTFFIGIDGSIDLVKVAFCYASGFSGVLLSPLHLCLLMSNIYFDADLKRVYYYLMIPVTITMGYAFYTVL